MEKPLRILIVDDNTINLKLLRMILERSGHRVTSAEDGDQAVREICANPYDVVFMDVLMPNKDGLEAVREIRSMGFVSLPIIGCTGLHNPEETRACLDAGMDNVILKPYSMGDLTRLLRKWGKVVT